MFVDLFYLPLVSVVVAALLPVLAVLIVVLKPLHGVVRKCLRG